MDASFLMASSAVSRPVASRLASRFSKACLKSAADASGSTFSDTIVETATLTVETQGGGPSGASAPVTVGPAGPYEVVKISGDAAGQAVGVSQLLTVEVRDPYGNVVPGTAVIFGITFTSVRKHYITV